jgi:hypothetical protein
MKRYEVSSDYRQFYVADAELQPSAPEDWDDNHVEQRHNTLENIAALCPEGDISARIISCGPADGPPVLEHEADFRVLTDILCPSGRVGVYGWPWELMDEYRIAPGRCLIEFTGHMTAKVDQELDYYVVRVSAAQQAGADGRPLRHRR